MIGHGAYLQQYQRRNDAEKEELYEELEPHLLIFDQTKNEEKIRKLKEANVKLADQDQRIREQEAMIRQLKRDQLNLEKLKEDVLEMLKQEHQKGTLTTSSD